MRTKITAALIALLVLAVAAPAAADAHESDVTVIHGVPGLTVDVWVDGEPFIEGFEPGTITDPVQLPEGTYEIAIYEAGADPDEADAAIEGSADVPAGANASVVAHLDADGTPTLSVFGNDTSALAAGESRLTARHLAAAPATDVRADGEPLFSGVENGDEGTVDVPAGTYSTDVTLAGEDEAVIGPVDLELAEGTHYLAYAIGSAEEETLDLLVQTIDLGAADEATDEATDDDDAEAPDAVHSGTGGQAAQGLPTWVALALAGGGMLALGGGLRFARVRA